MKIINVTYIQSAPVQINSFFSQAARAFHHPTLSRLGARMNSWTDEQLEIN